jgi:hypothetical protein
MGPEMTWYRVKLIVGGLVPLDMNEGMAALLRYLQGRDYIRSVRIELFQSERKAIVEAELQTLDPEDAVRFVEDELLREVPAVVNTLDNVYIDPIGAEVLEI